MSIEALSIALNHSTLEGTARLVLIGIANHDGDGGAWPSIASLARYAHVHPRTVQKVIPKIVAAREIRVVRNGGGTVATANWARPNLYEFLLRCPSWCDHTKNHRDTRGHQTVLFDDPGDNPLAEVAPGGNGGTTPLATGAPGGVATGAPEPPEEPTMNRSSALVVDAHASAGKKARPGLDDLLTRCARSSTRAHDFDTPSGWCRWCGRVRDDGAMQDANGEPLRPGGDLKAASDDARAAS